MRRGKGKRALAGLLAAALCAGLFFLPASAAPEGATVWGYSEGLAQCELAGKWGYVDAGRNVVIPLQYDSIVSFQLGIAAVNLNGKLGVIRQDGRYLIQPEYDTLLPIDCGLYIAQKGGGWGVVSILPFPDGAGSTTNVLYELSYDQVQVAEQGGTQVLTLTKGSTVTKIPVYDLPGILAAKGVPSAQFPLTWQAALLLRRVPPGLVRPLGGHRLQCGAHLRRGEEPLCAQSDLDRGGGPQAGGHD